MKIGMVCPYSIIGFGGVQTQIRGMADELRARGHQVTIITPEPPRKTWQPAPEGVIYFGGSVNIKALATQAQLSGSVAPEVIEEILDREQFDILHFHEPWVPFISRQILARATCPTIATVHARLPDTTMSKTIERVVSPYTRSILKYIDYMVAVSPAAAQYVRSISDKDVHIVPNAISTPTPKKSPKKRDENLIVFVGRLEKRKGLKYLLSALPEVLKELPQTRVVLIGQGDEESRLRAQADLLGLECVEFVGAVSDDEKNDYLERAKLFVSPAIYGESFGVVLLEAMARGAVCVAGDNPGYRGVMTGVGEISLVDPTDAELLARRIILLSKHEPLRQLWQAWAEAELKRYTFTAIVDQYEDLYKAASKKS